ncbi:MAG: glycoside hydrolase family 28 protein [Limisphaerales bacterium]
MLRKIRLAFIACAFLPPLLHPAQAWAAPPLPVIPSKTFNVMNYGARGDGIATNTVAIQAAIDASASAGGGTVEVPNGTFLCGPVHLASGVNLHLDAGADLVMLPLDKYPGGTVDPSNFISGSRLHDVAISGSGMINGQGIPWWPYARRPGARRPIMIRLLSCNRVLIEDVTLTNSPMFHIAIGGRSANVTVRGVRIRANPSSDPVHPGHNTDACDVSGTNILVENCNVSVGDDDFTCGGRTSDVLITNCIYGYGHGVSIGSGTYGGVSNVTVVNCVFNNTEAGIRIKSDRDRGGPVHNLRYVNLEMTNVNIPILIYGAYRATGRQFRNLARLNAAIAASYPAAAVTERTPMYSEILFSNITATVRPGGRAGLIWGLPEAPVRDVTLANVKIRADKPFGIYDAQNVRFVNPEIITPDGTNQLSCTNAQISIDP